MAAAPAAAARIAGTAGAAAPAIAVAGGELRAPASTVGIAAAAHQPDSTAELA